MTVLADRAHCGLGRRVLQAVAAYVPFSRVYCGVHYPTDVLGGVGLGLLLSSVWRGPVSVLNRVAIRTVLRPTAWLSRHLPH
jgi:membrane-associated phospholipid phosphatase